MEEYDELHGIRVCVRGLLVETLLWLCKFQPWQEVQASQPLVDDGNHVLQASIEEIEEIPKAKLLGALC